MASLDELSGLSDEELAELPDLPPSPLRRPPWWALLGILILVAVVVFVLLGEYNGSRYFLVCEGSAAEAHQGRGFPWPFGHKALSGPQYRAVPLGPETQCEAQELASEHELQRSLLQLVLAEVKRRRHVDELEELEEARRLVTQGLVLARGDKKARRRLESQRGALDLREGQLRLGDVRKSLLQIRRLFARARKRAEKQGQGVSVDEVDRVLGLVDHLLERIKKGRAPPPPRPPTRVAVPSSPSPPLPRPGTAPDATGSSDATVDAGAPPARRVAPTPDARPQPAIPLAPDASVSGGGILL